MLDPRPQLRRMWSSTQLPVRDHRFWLIQVLVVALAAFHSSIEIFEFAPHLGMLYFVPTALYFMPVIYAAVTFGARGSIVTAILCTVISIPNWSLWHSGFERYGDITQMALVDFFAVLIGLRVDEEKDAFSRLEAMSHDLELSQFKYRELFESAREGILVLDDSGHVLECNAAARMLGGNPSSGGIRYQHLGDVFPPEAARQILLQAENPEIRPRAIRLSDADGSELWVEPVCARLAGEPSTTQVLLRNVTRQRRQQIGLETYAAEMHRAQEDERRRIAQEIHDESVQSLVLLCRELDELEEACCGSPAQLAERVRGVRAGTEQIARSLRDVIRGLRPPVLDDLGVAPAIQRLLADVSARSAVETKLTIVGQAQRVNPDVELAMLRIAQEAIRNAERHSAPSQLEVRLQFTPQMVELQVHDDGVGLALPEEFTDLVRQGRWGLVGMHERARELGGELVVRSSPDAGTSVSVRFST